MTVALTFALVYRSEALSIHYCEASKAFSHGHKSRSVPMALDRENLILGRRAGLSGPKGA